MIGVDKVRGMPKGTVLKDENGKEMVRVNRDIYWFNNISVHDFDPINIELKFGDTIPDWFVKATDLESDVWEMLPYKGEDKND